MILALLCTDPRTRDFHIKFSWTFDSDDLRTANIIADEQEGVTCLVIDRETFNQLISSLDEIRTRYKDEGVERRR
jgi:hypothetical protein